MPTGRTDCVRALLGATRAAPDHALDINNTCEYGATPLCVYAAMKYIGRVAAATLT